MTDLSREKFYLVVPPGFEAVAAEELTWWLSPLPEKFEIEIQSGGIEAHLPLDVGLGLNHVLKIPSRILLVLKSFRCKDFTKLYKMVKKLPWNGWVGANDLLWSVSAKKSRLKIKSRIEKTCAEGFAAYRQGQPTKQSAEKGEVTVRARLYEDTCELSLDTSGEHLHRRGYKLLSSEAPIRENLAAALLWKMIDGEWERLGEVALIDPMCGSGTFAIEALRLLSPNEWREFAYRKTPLVRQVSPFGGKSPAWGKVSATDLLRENVDIAGRNALKAGMAERIDFRQGDFFKEPITAGGLKTWLIMNPPYGLRMKTSGAGYFQSIFSRAFELRVEKVGCIVPSQFAISLKKRLQGYTQKEGFDFKNGGVPVRFVIYQADASAPLLE